MSQTGGCSCGCGGHGKQREQDERTDAPTVTQPLGEGYEPSPVQTSPEDVDAAAIATAGTTATVSPPDTSPVTCWACVMSPRRRQAAVDAAAAVTDPDSVTRCGAGGPR